MVTSPSLQQFLAEFASLVDPLTERELRQTLTAYATGLPSGSRAAFLGDLKALLAPDASSAGGRRPDTLIADIEAFTTDVESGVFYDRWDWDPDLGHERAFGDASWAPRMDALFSRAAGCLLAGEYDLSARAHRMLFAALELEGDEGPLYSFETSAAAMLDTDLTEAAARALRSRLDAVADPATAAEELAELWLTGLPYGHEPRSLAAVREALPYDVASLADFAPHWTRALVSRAAQGHSPLRMRLLREAAGYSGGTDALAQAARAGGIDQPDAYLGLVDALRAQSEAKAATHACEEGLEAAGNRREGEHGWAVHQWAPLAERAAELAVERGDTEATAAHRARAFQLHASTRRLVALYEAAETHQAGAGAEAAGLAADEIAAGEAGFRHAYLLAFQAQALLLADRVDEVLALLPTGTEEQSYSSYRSTDVTMTVLPYVIAAASGAAARPDWPHTVLHSLFFQAATGGRTVRYSDERHEEEAEAGTAYATHLQDLLTRRATTPARRAHWLKIARAVSDRSVRRIVGSQDRASYEEAARLAAACAEGLLIADGDGHYLEGIRDSYPRHIAFRREVDAARRDSSLL
ncbi:hypothetical protein ABZV67_20140 [Streptomyces sp. NPDC005065]|uniref:hypothetical protein n=1 Tax=unclassified Streptomyces TaxID=2593676 RepID=UPI0033A8464D